MAGNAIERLLEAIDYPERAPGGAGSFVLQVDGGEIAATETDGKLRLVCRLTDDEAQLPRLAEYAAGRIMREEAAVAWDAGEPRFVPPGAILWREIPANADAHTLRRGFEAFCDSCDWWRARMGEDGGAESSAPFQEMMIRP